MIFQEDFDIEDSLGTARVYEKTWNCGLHDTAPRGKETHENIYKHLYNNVTHDV
jgi:hypothetical protein